MRLQTRQLWALPWDDERNAIACAAQAVMPTMKPDTLTLLQWVDKWQATKPDKYDAALVHNLANARVKNLVIHCWPIYRLLDLCHTITVRAVTGDLTSNLPAVQALMLELCYETNDADAREAMAKWRYFDATRRERIDDQMRAAFEAIWLAGEYKLAYEFVGVPWPETWIVTA